MNVENKLIHDIETNRSAIFDLGKPSNRRENDLTKELFKALGWDVDKKNYEGLFGWKGFRTDGCRKIDDTLVIIEVKKITRGSEYGYWHAFSQGLIYSYQQQHQSGNDFLVLCVILDWGKAAGQKLSEREKRFLNYFRERQIYFLRVNMIEKQFIEHNINTDWASIE